MFVRVDLVNQFQPRQDNATYGLTRLIDMAKYPLARAITFYAIADSNVNGAPIRIQIIGNDGPDPGSGLLPIGEARETVPNKYSKIALSLEIAKAPFPFYGVCFITGSAAPTNGVCWAFADIWWEG